MRHVNWGGQAPRLVALGKLALLLLIVSVVIVLSFRPPGPTYASVDLICPGDVNHDDVRDVRDAVLIQAHILGKTELSAELQTVADVNQDGQVDVLDIVRLARHFTRQELLPDCKATLQVSPGSLDFGSVVVAGGKELQVTVTNLGNATLAVTAMVSDNPQFSAPSPAVPFAVLPGASQPVTVRYTPAAAAAHSGTLTISGTSAGAAMSAAVALSGSGSSAYPKPALTSITPDEAAAGAMGLTLTLNGSNFMPISQALWNGSPRSTTFVSATQLTATIPASDLAGVDAAVIRVSTPAPGGGLSEGKLFSIKPADGAKNVFLLRYVVPVSGPVGTIFTLLGKGFSSTAANNSIVFMKPGSAEVAVTPTGASDTTLSGTIPQGMPDGIYTVLVRVLGTASNPISFRVEANAPYLNVRPGSASLLLAPGSGKCLLIIGGGKPPYRLKPIKAEQQSVATAELKGNVVEVTGLSAGQYGQADVDIQVEDSAATPVTAISTVRVRVPRYLPDFDVIPHSLLPGASPGFTLQFSSHYGDMSDQTVRIRIEKGATDAAGIEAGYTIGAGVTERTTFSTIEASRVAAEEVDFDVMSRQATGIQPIASGTVSPGAVFDISVIPEPLAEEVVESGVDSEFHFAPGLLRLPAVAGEPFDITAVFTSSTVVEGRELALSRTVTKSFVTENLPAAGPAFATLVPARAQLGRRVTLTGSGFSSTASANEVTFARTDGRRVPAVVASATETELVAYVPEGAASGPVRVTVNGKTSNDHRFWILFSPTAEAGLLRYPDQTKRVFMSLHQDWLLSSVEVSLMRIIFRSGQIDTSQLVKDVSSGWAHLTPYYPARKKIYYIGQEAEGARRHYWQIKDSATASEVFATIFLSANTGGNGVTLDLEPGSWKGSMLGNKFFLIFEKNWYVSPPAGGSLTREIQLWSNPWSFSPDGTLLVTMKAEQPIQ